MRLLIIISLLILASPANAGCSFKTSDFIHELRQPDNIEEIEIEVPKSGKFVRNALKILTSQSENIPPKLKRRYQANIRVHYSFGHCMLKGSVRQNGDWKDHIKFLPGGQVVQSLDVKLQTGNIMNAVSFKLLIPETRNGEHEILASLVLRHLGFLSPETFAIHAKINGVESVMLFQENARKELLEKNLRRESAIFEGDEKLLWSYLDFENFELEELSLSRQINDNWFLKGPVSSDISIFAFSKLQNSYLDYASDIQINYGDIILPNLRQNTDFTRYMIALYSMNGGHALRPHNRKYYYNAITSYFEPIYYDGNVNFQLADEARVQAYVNILKRQIMADPMKDFVKIFYDKPFDGLLRQEFLPRAKALNGRPNEFFEQAQKSYQSNITRIYEGIISAQKNANEMNSDINQFEVFKARSDKMLPSQLLIDKLTKHENGFYARFVDGRVISLSLKQVGRLLSNNTLNGQRAVFIGDYKLEVPGKRKTKRLFNSDTEILSPDDVEILVSEDDKIIQIKQRRADDTILIKNANLDGWTVELIGIEATGVQAAEGSQRFNAYGLTGCLTVYNSTFENTNFTLKNGACEDSLNIINSSGYISSIQVYDAYADAIDLDFSELVIGRVKVARAANDCLDVSGGTYEVWGTELDLCADKGLSVGEASKFIAKSARINDSKIGISSKDLSDVTIMKSGMVNVDICIEAFQKKQEFGGAKVSVPVGPGCEGKVSIGANSNLTELSN